MRSTALRFKGRAGVAELQRQRALHGALQAGQTIFEREEPLSVGTAKLAQLHERPGAAFARVAEGRITAAQAAATAAAQADAERLTLASLGTPPSGVALSFTTLPKAAFADLVGNLSNGRPLRALLDTLPPQAAAAVREALLAGLATGQGPREIARGIRGALGGNLTRALTIARTETLGAYRSAALRSYQANSDVISGWRWDSDLGPRCCSVCTHMHGSVHPLDEPMDTHPNC